MRPLPTRFAAYTAVALVCLPLLALPGSGPAAATGSAGGVTVSAPGAGPNATVTVSRTADLVNQTVDVSWSGFRPSSADRLDNSGDALDLSTTNPVRVYQCRGSDPASSSDCYGSPGFPGVPANDTQPAVPAVPAFSYPGQTQAYDANPDGPSNWQDNVTAADGTGTVSIQIFTKPESASLGCDAGAPCSLVVIPNYGRADSGAGATENNMDAPWAWQRRVVVPLSFLPTEVACPLDGAAVDVEGSPLAGRALASWRARTCVLDSGRVRLDYTEIGEPQTRADVAGSSTDVGLTIDPLDPAAAKASAVVYAPIAATALVVAFQVDDANGKPVRTMRLNARLVAKLITASYRTGGNDAVAGNPVNIFRDKEFLALNPGIAWPGGAPGNHVLLLGDLSDTTFALTRWLASDPDARSFLAGTPDPWGMKVNAHYRGLALPFGLFPLLDPLQANNFAPVQELDALARQVSIAQFPGALTTVENGLNVVSKPARQNPGRREVIGIIDAASAADFRLPTAQLLNAGGAYVAPDAAGILAGLAHAKVNPDGVTRSVDLTSKDRSVYPLSLLLSAVASTKQPVAARTAVARFLDYADGAGQVSGDAVGDLPEGYVPLPANLRALAASARTKLVAGYVAPRQPVAKPAAAAPAAEPGTVTPAAVAAPVPAAVPAPVNPGPVALLSGTTRIGPQPVLGRLITLPAVLILGLLAAATGPLLALLRRQGRGPAWLRR